MNRPDLSEWRVLVVDDEPDSIEIIEMVLGAAGATVYQAGDGKEAMNIFSRVHPTLVLSDISMPEMDGWEMLKQIKASKNGASVPVVALTAHAMLGDRERIIGAGFAGYMSKPLAIFTLLDDLVECLERVS
ncbi:MAG: response regulator [Anaerolineae bacterium]|nr:response regulator [Anaerolineae bacterium]